MAQPNVWAPVIAKLAELGVAVSPELKAKLDSVVEPLLDADANAIVTAVADHIEMHGLAGMMDDSLQNALKGSEPTIDAVLNSNVDGGAEYLFALLKQVAQPAA